MPENTAPLQSAAEDLRQGISEVSSFFTSEPLPLLRRRGMAPNGAAL